MRQQSLNPVTAIMACAAVGILAFWTVAHALDDDPVLAPARVRAIVQPWVAGPVLVEGSGSVQRDCRALSARLWLEGPAFLGLGPPAWVLDDLERGPFTVRGTIGLPEMAPGRYKLCASVRFQCGPQFLPATEAALECTAVTVAGP